MVTIVSKLFVTNLLHISNMFMYISVYQLIYNCSKSINKNKVSFL